MEETGFKFKIGDRVRHKLDRRLKQEEMIVVALSRKENLVYCRRYIVDKNEYKKQGFLEEELELVSKM